MGFSKDNVENITIMSIINIRVHIYRVFTVWIGWQNAFILAECIGYDKNMRIILIY